jgi:hypothetical protein
MFSRLALAREHLGPAAARVDFLRADFRDAEWAQRLAPVDAVVTMQAAHELRRKSRLPTQLQQIRELLRPGGLLLYCDHFDEPSSGEHGALFLDRQEQQSILADAGFAKVTSLREEGGMALRSARRYRASPPPLHSPRRRERTLSSPTYRKRP